LSWSTVNRLNPPCGAEPSFLPRPQLVMIKEIEITDKKNFINN
jgi:hypothetical protein